MQRVSTEALRRLLSIPAKCDGDAVLHLLAAELIETREALIEWSKAGEGRSVTRMKAANRTLFKLVAHLPLPDNAPQ